MNSYYDNFREKVLKHCQKPARYIGSELNITVKRWEDAKVRWGLLFPDLYEIGASNLGISLLYGILNKNSNYLCERFYFPDIHVIQILKKEHLSPLSLENKRPANNFHILGITLPYELTVTNVLKFLELSGIEIMARDRRSLPLIIGGGALCFNPEPIKDFFDLFVVGDGEDIVNELSEILIASDYNRERFLLSASKIKGVYVPSIHNSEKDTIKKIIVSDLSEKDTGTPLVPLIETTFNRLSIEIARGCLRGCRFCSAGFTQRPYRERNLKDIYEQFYKGLSETGFEEFSPSALSSSDFSCFSELFHCLYHLSLKKRASISFPSLRVGSIKKELAEKIKEVRKTGFTVAPESFASMQKKINKNIDFDKLGEDIINALNEGWLNIKLYLMIGFPDENLDDIHDFKRFLKEILYRANNRKANITLSFSNFIPKPHTPLQWERMNSLEELIEKQKVLKDLFFKDKKIYLKLHNPYMSIIEGVISRGDERLNRAIYSAYKKGAILDAWNEHFNFSLWLNAFNDLDLDYEEYLKAKNINERLPWSFINTGLTHEFLISEREKFKRGEITPDCREAGCQQCGVCDFKDVKNRLSERSEINLASPKTESYNPRKYLIFYTKNKDMIFLSNLDMQRLWHHLLRLSGINISYTKGFNPQPKIDLGWAQPLGISSYAEVLKLETDSELSRFSEDILKKKLPEGLSITHIIETTDNRALDNIASRFRFFCHKPYLFDTGDEIVVKRNDKEKRFVVSQYITDLTKQEDGFSFNIDIQPGGLKPIEFAKAVAGGEVTSFDLVKEQVYIKEIGWFGKRADD